MFNFQLADIDELILQCKSEEARAYIEEAYRSYKAGAYRNCIVGTWVAVVFDLLNKIRDMAVSGDRQAKEWVEKFENAQASYEQDDPQGKKKLLDFENEILRIAKEKFQLFGVHDLIDLERLHNDRNRCAHPSFQKDGLPYTPSAEQARYHLKSAIASVLAQQAIQGRHALDGLKQLVLTKYFPTKKEDAVEILRSSDFFSNPNETLIKLFVDYLCFDYINDDSPLYNKLKCVSALDACIYLHHDIAIKRASQNLSKISLSIRDSQMAIFLGTIGRIPELWDGLNRACKIKVKTYIIKGTIERFARSARWAMNVPELVENVNNRIAGLDSVQLAQIVNKEEIPSYTQRAIEIFCTTKSWDAANSVYDTIIEHILPCLSKADVLKILKAASSGESDLQGSFAFSRFLQAVVDAHIYSVEELNAELLGLELERHLLPEVEDPQDDD